MIGTYLKVPKGGTSQPKTIRSGFVGTCTIRYVSYSSGGNSSVVCQQDLSALVVVASSTTSAAKLMDSVRLRKIEMWGLNPAGANSTVSIVDVGSAGTLGGPERCTTDTRLGLTTPAHVVWTPMPGSIQATWVSAQNASVANLLALSYPAGAIVDVTLDYVIGEGTVGPQADPYVVAGATAGQVYYRVLNRNAAGNLTPQSVQFLA